MAKRSLLWIILMVTLLVGPTQLFGESREFLSDFSYVDGISGATLAPGRVPIWGGGSQEEEAPPEEIPTLDELSLEDQITLLEIRTLDIDRLHRWAKGLGIADASSIQGLQESLFNYYNIPLPLLTIDIPEITVGEGLGDISITSADSLEHITVTSADSFEQLTIEDVGEKYLAIHGNVVIQVSEDSTLRAQSLLYNQELEVFTALGDVHFDGGAFSDDIPMSGDYLSIRLADSTTVILEGSTQVDFSGGGEFGEDTTFFMRGESIILKEGAISLSHGSITSDPTDDPYYHLRTNRTQLYPDGTFTLTGAALYMGRVPVFYVPVFVHPGRDLVFHPSFGIDSTYGFYMNTTTYFWGNHSQVSTSEEEDALFTGFSSEDAPYREQQGIFLAPSDTPSKMEKYAERTGSSLALLADYYTRSGLFSALFYEKNKEETLFPHMDFGVGLANSYHIFRDDTGNYTRLIPSLGSRYRYSTYFFKTKIPFRFFWEANIDFAYKAFKARLSLPFYSDPYFASQFAVGEYFAERGQDKNLESLIFSSLRDQRNTARSMSTLLWTLDMELKPVLHSKIVDTLQLDRFEINLLWQNHLVDPQSEVFLSQALYPESLFLPLKLQIPLIKGEIGGTIFSHSLQTREQKELPALRKEGGVERAEYIAQGREDFESTDSETLDDSTMGGVEGGISSEGLSIESMETDSLLGESPDVTVQHAMITPYGYINSLYRYPWTGLTQKKERTYLSQILKYRLVTTTENIFHYTQTSLNPSLLHSYMNFAEYNYKGDLTVTYNLKAWEEFFSLTDVSTLSGRFQGFYNRNTLVDDAGVLYLSDALWDELLQKGYQDSYFWIKNELTAVLKPLFTYDRWADTNVTYNLRHNIFDYQYDSVPGSYVGTWHSWSADEVTEHTLSGQLIYKDKFFKGEITGKTILPPKRTLTQEAIARLYLYMGPLTFMGDASIGRTGQRIDDNPYVFDTWNQEPYNLSIAGDFGFLKFTQLFTMDAKNPLDDTYSTTTLDVTIYKDILSIENLLLTNLTPFTIDTYRLRAILFDLQATYEFANAGDGKLDLITSSYIWSKAYNPMPFWKNRFYDIVLEPDLAFHIDHLDKFNNTFSFGAKIQFKIFEFMDLTFEAQSKNSATYTYFNADSGFRAGAMIKDLAKSFNFFNRDQRMESQFKLDSVKLAFTHYMRDWTMTFLLRGDFAYETNQLDPTQSGFQWTPEYVFSVQWTPLKAIEKTTEIYRGDDGDLVIEHR